jgi:hypothetical protein
MSFIAPILDLIGLGLDLAGEAQKTQAAMQLADYRTEVANRNAAIMDENASRAIQTSEVDQQTQDMRSRAVIGDQIAAQGASGIKLSSDSFVRSRASTRAIAALDRLNVRHAGDVAAYNYHQQAADYRREAQFEHDTRDNAIIQGVFSGLGDAVRFGGQFAKDLSYAGAT